MLTKRNRLFKAIINGNEYEFRFDAATQSVYKIQRTDLGRDDVLVFDTYIFPEHATKKQMIERYEEALEQREEMRLHRECWGNQ